MGHARRGLGLRARAFSRSSSVVRALPGLCDLLLEVRHVDGQLLEFREARGAAARRLIGGIRIGLELLGDPGLGLGRRGGAGREEDHLFVLGCPLLVASRLSAVNDFDTCRVRGANLRERVLVLCHRDSSHYSVASRMTPERHDDVEYVVGRARGDVSPENTHELSPLAAFV